MAHYKNTELGCAHVICPDPSFSKLQVLCVYKRLTIMKWYLMVTWAALLCGVTENTVELVATALFSLIQGVKTDYASGRKNSEVRIQENYTLTELGDCDAAKLLQSYEDELMLCITTVLYIQMIHMD
ncbi:hypothetical protein KIN20_020594 [Parelaphostrongylus tenuis]|uniref:Uncharacterized protein n=1 Tax=Parelaphostrongylus tenuis TaxID=148309 RepID=A0AAD5MMU7_PARTN|nr:hypothetical protein KIN20_020594 [Parelaphostrongylus tenuis]